MMDQHQERGIYETTPPEENRWTREATITVHGARTAAGDSGLQRDGSPFACDAPSRYDRHSCLSLRCGATALTPYSLSYSLSFSPYFSPLSALLRLFLLPPSPRPRSTKLTRRKKLSDMLDKVYRRCYVTISY